LTLRELGTVLAALRYWQRYEDGDSEERYLIAEDPKGGALSADEIDELEGASEAPPSSCPAESSQRT
jgi:hypothetical protein